MNSLQLNTLLSQLEYTVTTLPQLVLAQIETVNSQGAIDLDLLDKLRQGLQILENGAYILQTEANRRRSQGIDPAPLEFAVRALLSARQEGLQAAAHFEDNIDMKAFCRYTASATDKAADVAELERMFNLSAEV